MSFKRELSQNLIDNLSIDQLYIHHLLKDIKECQVFAAIRNNYIDFYYKGGRLFQYTRNSIFKTHYKFASVISNENRQYLSERELTSCRLIKDFSQNYSRIKENCANYSGVESIGVANLYSRYSVFNKDSKIVVLDIEISLSTDYSDADTESKRKSDRIDLLLYNTDEKILRFYEAKHFSNPELWSEKTREPNICKQLFRYKNQLKTKTNEILSSYKKYTKSINTLFHGYINPLPEPMQIDLNVPVYIFGFDDDQKKGRLDFLRKNSFMVGHDLYAKGNPTDININNLWNRTKRI